MNKLVIALILLFAFGSLTQLASADPPQNFVLRDAPAPVPELSFTDADGKPLRRSGFCASSSANRRVLRAC